MGTQAAAGAAAGRACARGRVRVCMGAGEAMPLCGTPWKKRGRENKKELNKTKKRRS